MDRFGLIFGLGLVLSFGFWGTDFVQMQRALAVRKAQDAPFVPLSIGFAKLVFAMLVVVPAWRRPSFSRKRASAETGMRPFQLL